MSKYTRKESARPRGFLFRNSLRSRITIIFTTLIVMVVLTASLLVQHDVKKEITAAETKNANNMLNQVYTSIDNEYKGFRYYKKTLLEERKEGLKHITKIALKAIEKVYKEGKKNNLDEEISKQQAMEILRSMRYANGSGYVWIQDTTLPIPNMLMHPTVPGLEGESGKESIYFDAMDGRKNLLAEFVKAARKNRGSAFMDYQWPKPTKEGLTSMQPKYSHVRIFKPWGWLIGTGLYTDDIRDACQKHMNEIIDAMANTLSHIHLAQTGYVFVFDGDYDIIIHPELQGTNGKLLKNPATGTYLFQDIMDAANTPEGKLEYPWNKPGEPKDKMYEKVAYVRYYEPLDWYVAASIYSDELSAPAAHISNKILWGSLLFLILTTFMAWWLARGISKPLSDLTTAAEKVAGSNLGDVDIPLGGTYEIRSLGESLQSMINRLDEEQKERNKMENLLHQSEKMRAIGNLAGGIAHDLNNMLAGIHGAIELLSTEISNEKEKKEYIEIIEDATNRASELTQKLLSFSRKGKNILFPVNLHTVIQEAYGLLERSIDKRISLSTNLNADVTTVVGDSSLLQNAILNLGINARDAIPENGTITIETKNVTIKDEPLLAKPMEDCDLFIEISVRDTGTGMTKDVQEHIFDPFFTTKNEGEGTGLGLASVYRVVKDHHGVIRAYSELGMGTVFKIYLPVDKTAVVTEQAAEKEIIHGKGKILLVDDEQIVRTTSADLLENLGYEVILAEDGQQAVKKFRKFHDQIDLVMLDVVMPRMGGREAFRELKTIDPDIKVIFCSGFTRENGVEKLIQKGARGFLSKPYNKAELSQLLAKVLQS